MLTTKKGTVLEADIHGMTCAEAKKELERLLSRVPQGVKEVDVIHGYNGGQVLRDMVRTQLKHPRISSKMISLNPGQTRIILKDSTNT